MNLQKVFGIVVGAHVVVLTFIIATPGCRSGAKSKPRPEDTAIAAADPIAAPAGSVAGTPVESMSYDAVNAGEPVSSPSSVSPVASVTPVAPADPYSADGVVRFAPSRPSTAISPAAPTPVASSSSATHTVAKGDNLWAIAKKYGITVGELAAANQLAPSATLRLGQQLSVPARAAADTGASVGAATSEAANTYAVKSGDTLGAIARKQGTTVAALRAANNLSGDNLRVGQKLVIPGNATPLGSSSSSAPSASSSAAPQAGAGTYTIVPGDTLGSIAQRHGVKSGDLAVLNNITDPKKLRVGQVIKLPTGARSSSSSSPAATSAPAYTPTPSFTPSPVEPEPTGISPVTPIEPVTPVEPDAVPVTPIFN